MSQGMQLASRNWKKGRKTDSPAEPPEGTQPSDFSLVGSFQISDLQNDKKKFCVGLTQCICGNLLQQQ